jgi:hypothetical protein
MFADLDSGATTLGEVSSGKPSREGLMPFVHWEYRYSQGVGLRFLNRAVEIARRPIHEQPDLWTRWEEDRSPESRAHGKVEQFGGMLAYLLLPSLKVSAKAHAGNRAALGAITVLIAAERYRRAQGAWPGSVEAIESALSVKLPGDPYLPGPFRLKRAEDGLIVYSVGPNLRDDGGNLNNGKPDTPGIDIGFLLWDVERRRQVP